MRGWKLASGRWITESEQRDGKRSGAAMPGVHAARLWRIAATLWVKVEVDGSIVTWWARSLPTHWTRGAPQVYTT